MRKILFSVILLILFAGCSQIAQQTTQQSASSGNAPMTATVYIYDNQFSPDTVTISAGGTVTWTNRGAVSNTVSSIQASPEEYNSNLIGVGESWSRQFKNPGTFKYFSAQNSEARGTVIVQ